MEPVDFAWALRCSFDAYSRLMSIVDDVMSGADWIASALNSSGYEADFSPSSLCEVDRFYDEHTSNGAALPNGLLAEETGARLFALGSYVGEVIRQSIGGEWVGNDDDPQAEINVELRLAKNDRVWPTQRAMKRFSNGPEDSIAAYGSALGLRVGDRPSDRRHGWFNRRFGRRR